MLLQASNRLHCGKCRRGTVQASRRCLPRSQVCVAHVPVASVRSKDEQGPNPVEAEERPGSLGRQALQVNLAINPKYCAGKHSCKVLDSGYKAEASRAILTSFAVES
jgi:hypothetical protein